MLIPYPNENEERDQQKGLEYQKRFAPYLRGGHLHPSCGKRLSDKMKQSFKIIGKGLSFAMKKKAENQKREEEEEKQQTVYGNGKRHHHSLIGCRGSMNGSREEFPKIEKESAAILREISFERHLQRISE